MFQIDDNFLSSIGYDVENLSDEEKSTYIEQLTNEINDRTSERLISELTDEQIDEFNDIQENPERSKQWLNEFHFGYQNSEDFKTILTSADSEDDATVFYAVALWMRDAVPAYGELLQDELNTYQQELIRMREAANKAVDESA